MAETEGRRAAIVTGGASGIGLACAERLLASGWRVGIVDRDETAVTKMAANRDDDARCRSAVLDVTDEHAVEEAVGAMAEQFGRLDGLVNSAGIGADMPALDTPVDLFRKILDVNVLGTFLVSRAAARRMQARGSGSIVNIASISGLRGSKGRAAYGASKGAVITLTQVMAVEWARFGIRVNALAPGPVDTPLVQAVHTPAIQRAYRHHIPMRRYGAPGEIAGAALFLLDDSLSSYVTGEVLAADGGYRGAGLMELDEP